MAYNLDQDIFLLEAYFRNGERRADGSYDYSMQRCFDEVVEKFPDHPFVYNEGFQQRVRRLLYRFRETGSVCRRKSSGRRTVLTEDVLEDILARLKASPNKSLRALSAQTGLSYGTVQKAVKRKRYELE